MNSTKIIGVILIVVSLVVGYLGFKKIDDNSKEINLLGIKVNASDESGKKQGYLYLGLAIVIFGGGIYTITRSKN